MKARPVKKLDPRAPLLDNAARILRVRVRELCAFAPEALDSDRSEAQHDMRIAAKRLRYVLETTELCFGRPAENARRAAKQLQDVLGELHDCDVMAPRIAAHAAELRDRDAESVRARAAGAEDLDPALAARAPHRTSYRGLGVLSVHVEARRRVLFDRFAELWAKHERNGTWKRLDRAIDRKLAEASARREAAERARLAALELERAERAEAQAAGRARRAAEALADARRLQGTEPPSPRPASPAPRAE